MRVRLGNAVAVSTPFGTGSQRTIPVVADDASSGVRTPRGGIVLRAAPRDVNPEIAYLYAELVGSPPDVNVGDHFTTPVVGTVDSYDLFEINVTSPLTAVSAGLTPSSAPATGSNEVSIATFSVNNPSPVDPQSKVDGLAAVIVGNLKAPDVIAVEEVQDSIGTGAGDGSTPTGTTANLTWTKLIAAVQAAGGPVYDHR